MKELTKTILEAGLVDDTTAALLARWGALSPEELAQVQHKQVVAETLETFLEKLETLLDQDPPDTTADKPMHETFFEITVREPPVLYFSLREGYFAAVRDIMGHVLVTPSHNFCPGDLIFKDDVRGNPPLFKVDVVDKLYKDDQVCILQLTVS